MKTYVDLSAYILGKEEKKRMEGWTGDTWSSSQTVYNPPPKKDPIETATDDELVLELVKRGYAVGRLNENNQLEA